MTTPRDEAYRVESEFLAGVQANLAHPRVIQLLLKCATHERIEDVDAGPVRAAMIEHDLFDRGIENSFPGRRTIVYRGVRKRLFFIPVETGRAILTVIAPPDRLLSDGPPPRPITLAEVKAHVRKKAGMARGKSVVAVCSPSGFADDVWQAKLDMPGVRVVMVAPKADGLGWRVRASGDLGELGLLQLFDPETHRDKFQRVHNAIKERGGDLLTGGVSAESLARDLEMPREFVRRALARISHEDPEIRLSTKNGETLIYRGVAGEGPPEGLSMSVTDWFRSLFSSKGDEAKKINMLSEKRAALTHRRDRFYEDIGRLEDKEAKLLKEGKSNKSSVARRRLAAQVAQLRRDISRANTTAAMLNQQINVISTHIHNLTLIQQGEMAKLPNAEDLTEDAVKAEEMLEGLRADAELVGSLETGTADAMITDDEAAILAEFAAADEPAAPQKSEPSREKHVAERPAESTEAGSNWMHEDDVMAEFEADDGRDDDGPDSSQSKDKRIAE
jgi:hypothetical protein